MITIAALAIIIYVIYQISENEAKKKAEEKRRIERERQIRKEQEEFDKELIQKEMDIEYWYGRH